MKRLLLILSIACIVGSAFGEDQSLKSYVDMGLPSGTLWKSKDEPGGLYSQTEAMEKFGDKLPTEEQIRELVKSCKWTWDGGTYTYKVVGPNGKSIIFKATGTWPCEPNYKGFYECDRSRIILDNSGGCWSSSMDWHENYGTYYHLYFDPGVVNVYTAMSICGMAVRLVDKGQSNLEEKVADNSYWEVLSDRKLVESDLRGKSADELSIMRNSIYARHGYRFKKQKYLDYFGQFDWYRPNTDNQQVAFNRMSSIEKYNVNFIREHE